MNSRIWGIIGGVALVLALLSPLVLGNANKVKVLFEEAEVLYERQDYEAAIPKYSEALQESKKIGVNTETIDIDFTTLVNLKIVWCYYELGEKTSDVRHNQNALIHIKEVALDTQVARYKEELTYLWAENLYKIAEINKAESEFDYLIEKFPNSRWVPNALYTMAEIAYQQDNCEKTLNILQKLVTEFPQSTLKQEAERRIVELNELCNELPPPPPPPLDPCKEIYNTAFDLQQQGKVHDAYELYTDLITQYPDSEYVPHAYVGIAEIYLEAKDYVNARANYEEAIYNTTDEERKRELYVAYHRTYLVPVYPDRKPQPDQNDELFVKARLLRLEKRWLEAAQTYEKLTDRNLSVEDMVYALYWGGRCYYETAQADSMLFSKSVDALTELITAYENSGYDIKPYYYLTLAYTDWAEASDNLSRYQLVIETFERTNETYKDSNDSKVQELLSEMRRLKEDAVNWLHPLREEAERSLNEAEAAIATARRENTDPQIISQANEHLENAKQHISAHNYEEVIRLAERVVEIIAQIRLPPPPPPPPQHYVDKGYEYFSQGELDKTLEQAEHALEINPNYVPARELKLKIKQRYAARGRRFFEEEKYDEAIVAFEDAISVDTEPKFKETYNYLGVIYIGQGKYHDAIGAFSEAVRIDANFKEAYFNRALAHLELREFEKAIENAEEALRIDPAYEPARMLIDLVLTQL